jgi:phosphotransferase system enzyme I (PtsI)
MGLRSFSMSPAFIPSMKELLVHLSVPNAEAIHRRVLGYKMISQVSRYLGEQVRKICPNLAMLDTA